jgi:Protein of unknown function (DUF2497)
MTIINGANNHNVEDILSSIRNSMGEEHAFARAATVKPFARRDGGLGDEGSEFELPAIFKPGHHATVEKAGNIFGRLGDAIKPATSPENERSRTVIRFEPAAARMIEPPAAMAAAQQSQTKPDIQPEDVVLKESTKLKREMPSFFDTRLNKLGELTRQASVPKAVEQPLSVPQALVPQQPPPLRTSPPAEMGGEMEDAAAQLLRPILKQWLMENMPKIVEKALRSEAGEEITPQTLPTDGRKPGQ